MFKFLSLDNSNSFIDFYVGLNSPSPVLINQNSQTEEHLFEFANFCSQNNTHFEHVIFDTLIHIPQETPDFLVRSNKAKELGKKVLLVFTGVSISSIDSQNLIFKNQMPFNKIPEDFYCAFFTNIFASNKAHVLFNHAALT